MAEFKLKLDSWRTRYLAMNAMTVSLLNDACPKPIILGPAGCNSLSISELNEVCLMGSNSELSLDVICPAPAMAPQALIGYNGWMPVLVNGPLVSGMAGMPRFAL